MGFVWKWLATRAASAWIAFAGLALVGACWFAYDHRGDRIADLDMQLLECNGTAKQAKAIKELSKRVTDQLQERADDEIDDINALPTDECYRLDDPSPRNGLRESEEQESDAALLRSAKD